MINACRSPLSTGEAYEGHTVIAPILPGEITYSDLSWVDPLGRLFHWKGGIYRGIYRESAGQVRALFSSGFLEELTARGLFPRSTITPHTLEGFELVVEHEAMPYVLYPHEWSFDMFRDAALAVLDVVEIGARYGLDIKDCGPQNVLFKAFRPMFVDLGSFRSKPRGAEFEKGPDFLRAYWRPLTLWSTGEDFLARLIISSTRANMPDFNWWLYEHSAWRFLGLRVCTKLAKWSSKWARRAARLLRHGRVVTGISPALASRLPVEVIARTPALLRRKLERLKPPSPSVWDDYHSCHLQDGAISSTPRFDRIVEIVRETKSRSVTELAGNQGVLSLLLAGKTKVEKIVCTDYSASAVNRLHQYGRKYFPEGKGTVVQGAVLDFMQPDQGYRETAPAQRLQSDVVLALAVTHHLVLSQGYPLPEILKTIAGYTRRYALIEFMPLGLWAGRESDVLPPVPDWYTREWFGQAFAEFFEVIAVEQVEKNRILFVGELKAAGAGREERGDLAAYFERRQAA